MTDDLSKADKKQPELCKAKDGSLNTNSLSRKERRMYKLPNDGSTYVFVTREEIDAINENSHSEIEVSENEYVDTISESAFMNLTAIVKRLLAERDTNEALGVSYLLENKKELTAEKAFDVFRAEAARILEKK